MALGLRSGRRRRPVATTTVTTRKPSLFSRLAHPGTRRSARVGVTATAAPVGRSRRRRSGRPAAIVPGNRSPTIGMRIHGAARKLAGRLTGRRDKVVSGESE